MIKTAILATIWAPLMLVQMVVYISIWSVVLAAMFAIVSGTLRELGLGDGIFPLLRTPRLFFVAGRSLCLCYSSERWVAPGDARPCLGNCTQSRYHPCNQK